MDCGACGGGHIVFRDQHAFDQRIMPVYKLDSILNPVKIFLMKTRQLKKANSDHNKFSL